MRRSQKSQHAKKVFVQADSIRVNDPIWVQNPRQSGKHIGWVVSNTSLQEQGSSQGRSMIWMPTPQVTAYPLQSRAQPSLRQATQSSRQNYGQSRKRKHRKKDRPSWGQPKVNKTSANTWIPKDRLTQWSVNQRNNLVRIRARGTTSKGYKQWILPQDLLIAQGYYKGQAQFWVPKSMIDTKEGSPLPKERSRPQKTNQTNQQRPTQVTTSNLSYKATSSQMPGEQRWVPKNTFQTSSRLTPDDGLRQDMDQMVDEILCQWDMQ